MKKVSLLGQLTFDEMKRSLERLLKTNRWVQMGILFHGWNMRRSITSD